MTSDHDRDMRNAETISSLRTKIPQGVDERIINIIELYLSPEGERTIRGHTYSIDNEGNDISVSWGSDIRPEYILYLIDETLIYVSSGAEICRLSIQDADQNPYKLVELSEAVQS